MGASEQIESKMLTNSPSRTRSICCCCCRREPRDVHEDRNGIRLALYSETLPSSETEQNIPKIKTFQQDLTGKEKSDTPARRQKCAKKCVKCCKKFTTFLFSNIGLCSAVVAYSILGGFIFQNLEAPNEILKRHQVTSERKSFAKDLWELVDDEIVFFEDNFTQAAEMILIKYQKVVLDAKKNGWDGAEGDDDAPPQWSYAGSLLYAVTVITTIGYGHIAPKTFNGQLVTIFYALFGIPLTLLCLANMGSFLGNCFRLLYKHLCRLLTWMCCPPEDSFTKSKSMSLSNSKNKITQETDPLQGKIDDPGGVHTLQVVPAKIGKQKKSGKRSQSRSRSTSPSRSEINIVVEDFDKPKTKETIKTEDIRVPVFVSLMIIALYVLGGALMFSMWEDWNYLEGSYFCFITLSTIGFGDYVPGSISGADSADNKERLIICCAYLMFGLSILAMCFNLMQEDVRAKFLWLAVKIGLIDVR
ncbi:potassium channel subfamily K member 18-like [Mercenaria mercenaria]|uniref:potassium channel subfamily K member 18-like n=1 Tax=Mercenaria mercenaria TaxID=6596 RepID=UPI00234F1B2E|nr:potassium channel subfamily K member 18-like [Mercenaria mercenaria]XP_053375180.1 potassium channel subfamily K member 18-like [Mercenaria mercenaria]XP_053375181.1 potassium channel subfamily K member 18-like [Mercenaria mercenaria]XP_053375182.1 potassium channel subfamily K member 18-like [Mercenaria mercenaria]XP_053375183.1 potassium channel subfamily K member 18-like [Mercenaria mercenaria]XP_053375184.1 potassium channel subfamily K member 18-like [Mercenaria mercenaria]